MARTPEQILRDIIGGQAIQIATLMSDLEKSREEAARVKAEGERLGGAFQQQEPPPNTPES